MNLAGIIWDAVNIYDGVAVEIYISGCYHNCPGCHNPEMQNYDYGKPFNYKTLYEELNNNQDWFDIVSILGGDLLCQINDEAKDFSQWLKLQFKDKKLWLFTGKDFEEIEENYKWCFDIFDVIKTGRYMKNLESDDKLASFNQKLLYKGINF
jgi:anaerobic ribonucleoside-triphosphate reductase activating protein